MPELSTIYWDIIVSAPEKKYDSIALVAGGKHLQSDTYSSIGLVIGLILMYITRIRWIDSALALIFGTIIIFTGISILKKTVANLMDKADKEILSIIADIISKNRQPDWIDIHNLKMVKYGSYYYIDCDLTLPWYYNIEEGHSACINLEKTICKGFTDKISFSVHSDSCAKSYCRHCQVTNCTYRKQTFVSPLQLTLKEITESDEERNE